jgi:hypothetical protein
VHRDDEVDDDELSDVTFDATPNYGLQLIKQELHFLVISVLKIENLMGRCAF